MKHIRTAALVCLAFALAACGGGGHLSVETPGGGEKHETHILEFTPGEPAEYRLPFRISGGIPPYKSELLDEENDDCPHEWVTLFPDQRILAGTAPAADAGRTFFCIYEVTESDPGFRDPRSVTHGLRLQVRALEVPDLMLPPPSKEDLSVGTFRDVEFPPATGGVQPYTYTFDCAGGPPPPGMNFAPATRRFAGTPRERFRDSCTYSVTDSSAVPTTVSQAVEIEVAGPVTGTLMLPATVVPGNVIRLRMNERARVTFQPATGGVEPRTYQLQCPNSPPIGPNVPSMLPPPGNPPFAGLGFGPLTRVLSGTPTAEYTGPDCTYSVTDSATPPATLAKSVALIIEPERTKWRFDDGDRSLTQDDEPLMRDSGLGKQVVHQLPEAEPGSGGSGGTPVYRLLSQRGDLVGNDSRPLAFNAAEHKLEYEHPCDPDPDAADACDPPPGKTFTYRYQVLFGDTVDDTLCIDVSYRKDADADDDPKNDPLIASVRIHDNAF